MNGEQVIALTADLFGYTVDDLIGPDKSRPVSMARAVAMYAVRETTDLSYPAIGILFDRDHSTIINGRKKIERLLSDSPELRGLISKIGQTIKQTAKKQKLTRIHVNQHIIKAQDDAPITVKTYDANRKANQVSILDGAGNVCATIIYRPDDPLPCGTRIWIETRNEVVVHE